jgi:hypothetical protein
VGGKSMDTFFKPSVIRIVGEKGGLKHLDFLLSFLNNKNTMYFKELSNGVLKIVSREGVKQLEEEHVKFILRILKNSDNLEDERMTLLYIVSQLEMDGKEELYEELGADKSEPLSLQAFEYLAEINRERAVKLVEKKIKMADGDYRRMLISFLESLKEL